MMRKHFIISLLFLLFPLSNPPQAKAEEEQPLFYLECDTQQICALLVNPTYKPPAFPPFQQGSPVILHFTLATPVVNATPVGSPIGTSINGDTIFGTAPATSLFMVMGGGTLTAPFNTPEEQSMLFSFQESIAAQTPANRVFTFTPQNPSTPLLTIQNIRIQYRASTEVFQTLIRGPLEIRPLIPPVATITTTTSLPPTPAQTHNAGGQQRVEPSPPLEPEPSPTPMVFTGGGGGGGGSRGGSVGGVGPREEVGEQTQQQAPCFPDIADLPQSQQEAICALKGKVIDGKPQPDGSRLFDPHTLLNRAEAAKIVAYALLTLQTGEFSSRETEIQKFFDRFYPNAQSPQLKNKPTRFADVSRGQWYAAPVNWLATENIVSGYGGTQNFGPSNTLQRVELEKIAQLYFSQIVLADNPNNVIANHLKTFTPSPEWWTAHYAFTQMNLPFTQMATLSPTKAVTRAEFAEYFYRLLLLVKE